MKVVSDMYNPYMLSNKRVVEASTTAVKTVIKNKIALGFKILVIRPKTNEPK